jgi:hypothetical protein
MISVICREFSCTPDVALRQDPRLVRAILDYRRLAAFEAGGDDPDRVIDYDELSFVEEVKALALEGD